MCVECPEDGKLSPERRTGVRGACSAFRCHIEIESLYVVCHEGDSFMSNTKKLVMMSFLISLTIVLARFLAIQNDILRISLEFLPIMVAAVLFGPVAGGLVGAIADLIGATLFPAGTFFPGFTISAFITGFIYGMFFYKKQITWLRALLGTFTKLVVVDLLMISTWMCQPGVKREETL